MKIKPVLTAASAICSASLVAACSSSGSAATKPAANTQSSAATNTQSKTPVKIGVLLASTGSLITLGEPDLAGVRLAVSDINKAGGIDGRQIDLVYQDDQSSPQVTVSAARQLVQDGVVGIIGPESTSLGTGIEPIVNAAKIPEISLQGGISLSGSDGYVFGNTLTGATVVQASINYMKAHNIAKIGYLTTSDSLGKAGDKYGYPLFANAGIQVVGGKQTIDPTGSDFSTQLTAVKDAGAQSVFIWASGAPLIVAAKNFAALGMPGKLFLLNLSVKDAANLGPGTAVSLVGQSKVNVASQLTSSDPTYTNVTNFVKEAKAGNVTPDNYSAGGWGAVHAFADSISKVGTSGQAIYNLWTGGYQPPYASGRVSWSSDDHQGFNPDDVVMTQWDPASQTFKIAG